MIVLFMMLRYFSAFKFTNLPTKLKICRLKPNILKIETALNLIFSVFRLSLLLQNMQQVKKAHLPYVA